MSASGGGRSVGIHWPVTDIELIDSISFDRQSICTVIWATGYTYDYHWVRVPVFDARGRPLQRRGVTDRPGLYFLGLHWMHTFKSGLFSGVGVDADTWSSTWLVHGDYYWLRVQNRARDRAVGARLNTRR